MNPVFLVTSAIYTDHGIYSSTERMAQTIKTFESIQEYCSEADIILLEASAKQSITEDDTKELSKYTKLIINQHIDTEIQNIYKLTTNHDIVKNYTEMLLLIKSIVYLKKEMILDNYDRVFKISGRYELNEDFYLTNYELHSNEFVVSNPRASQFDPVITGFAMSQCMTRLWSFPSQYSGDAYQMLDTMLLHFMNRVNSKGYIDCEHLLYAHLPRLHTHYVEKIGVEGRLGPNGVVVKD